MLWVVAAEKKSIWLWPEKILATTNFYIATMPLYKDNLTFDIREKLFYTISITLLFDLTYTQGYLTRSWMKFLSHDIEQSIFIWLI